MNYANKVLALTNAYATGSNDYDSTVRALLDAYVTRRIRDVSMAPLLSLLGCQNVRNVRGSLTTFFEAPAQPPAEHEAIITQALVSALRLHIANGAGLNTANGCAILDGLVKNHRWRACLDSVTAANDLALLLLDASVKLGHYMPSGNLQWYTLVSACIPSLYSILNEWLRPPVDFSKGALMPDVARAMFGDAWYDLIFGGERWFNWPASNEDNSANRAILASIQKSRPLFLADLLSPGVGEQERMELPDLGTAEMHLC